nr:hypothetical protein [Candidatus Goldiibacteriota bacterium]
TAKSQVPAKKQSKKADTAVPAAETKKAENKTGNKKIITFIIVAVVVLLAAEMAFVISKQAQANKKPVLVSAWDVQYGTQVGMPVSGSSLYVIDSRLNQIKSYEKMDGKLKETYQFDSVPKWAGEMSDGRVFVLLNDAPVIYEMKKNKAVEFITEGMKQPINFVIDSENSIIVSDQGTGKIIKYDSTGNKVFEIGGRGMGKGKFLGNGRVTVDNKDNIYVLEGGAPFMVKIFDKAGKFLKEWKMPVKQMRGMENLAVTHDGNVYINDWNDSTIKVFSNNGKLLGKFINDAAMTYKIGAPGAFSGGPDNYIYVGSHNMAVFEPVKY